MCIIARAFYRSPFIVLYTRGGREGFSMHASIQWNTCARWSLSFCLSLFLSSKIDHHCQLCRDRRATLLPHTGESTGCLSKSGSQRSPCLLSDEHINPSDGFVRLGNPGGILFNIYIYIYMSNGDRPSASLIKGRERRAMVVVEVAVVMVETAWKEKEGRRAK